MSAFDLNHALRIATDVGREALAHAKVQAVNLARQGLTAVEISELFKPGFTLNAFEVTEAALRLGASMAQASMVREAFLQSLQAGMQAGVQ